MLHNWGQMPYKERSLSSVLIDIDSKCKKYNITKAVIDYSKMWMFGGFYLYGGRSGC